MKRSFLLFVTVCLLLGILSGTAVFAAEPTSGSCGDNVTWKYSASTGKLTVSGSGEMYAYAENWGWDAYYDSITSVSISNGVTSIGAYAFAYLPNLKTVSLPSSLDYIYEGAFEGCESLTSVTLPEGLLELYEFAFYGCTGLTGITLPNSLEYLGMLSFTGCTALTKFTVSSSHSWLSTDSSGVLFNKDKTALYMAPGGLSGGYSIPGGVVAVYPYAFNGCGDLTGLFIPTTVTTVGNYSLLDCTSLENIWVSESNNYFSHDSKGLLYNKNKTTLLQVPCGKTGAVSIAGTVTAIQDYALFGCHAITNVTLPEGLKTVGEGAFGYCIRLESIALPDSVTKLAAFVFEGCVSLQSAKMPVNYREIPESTFANCTNLREFIPSNTLNNIGAKAFYNCSSLESIQFNAVELIGEYAFAGCTALKEFRTNTPGSMCMPDIKTHAFAGCTALTDLYFTEWYATISQDAFLDVTATVHYPGNPMQAWENTEKLHYGGTLTWEPYYFDCESHTYDEYPTPVYDSNYTCYVCSGTMDVYVSQNVGVITCGKNYRNELYEVTVSVKEAYAGQEVALHLPQAIASSEEPPSGQVIHVTVPEGTSLTLTIPVSNVTANTAVYLLSGTAYTCLSEAETTADGVTVTVTESCDLVISEREEGKRNPFTDVPADRFEEAILWAYHNGITTGTGDGTTFSPEATCTRKQIVTFLWRAAGEPEPKSMDNPFTDVPADRFEKAILWAYYEGITTGTGDGTTFSPENTCTRKQIVTFLWRFHDEPAPESMEITFTDVKNDRFAPAILWAAEQGITTGTGDGTTFSPENPCTRKQIVTFLYRDLAQ